MMAIAAAAGAAWYSGLMSSPHCVAMCGGIAAGCAGSKQRAGRNLTLAVLGRLISYGLFGAIGAATFGATLGVIMPNTMQPLLSALVGAMLFIVGLQLLWFQPRLGGQFLGIGSLWHKLQHKLPLQAATVDRQRGWHQLLAGIVWGLLPCGLIYTMLPVAWATGSAWQGALVMVAFGLGTSPVLVAIGLGIGNWRFRLRRETSRKTAGLAIGALGLTIIGLALSTQFPDSVFSRFAIACGIA